MTGCRKVPVMNWRENKFDHALDYALAWGREDYVSILYLCRRASLCPGECFALTLESAARAVEERELTYTCADGTPRTVELDSLLEARLKRDLTGAATGCALYLKPGQKAEEAERALWAFLRDCSITWEEGDQDD